MDGLVYLVGYFLLGFFIGLLIAGMFFKSFDNNIVVIKRKKRK